MFTVSAMSCKQELSLCGMLSISFIHLFDAAAFHVDLRCPLSHFLSLQILSLSMQSKNSSRTVRHERTFENSFCSRLALYTFIRANSYA